MSVNTTEDAGTDLEFPLLRDGDRLKADEFHRRYEAMRHVKNANLINGVVHMSSPVYLDQHGGPHWDMIAWMGIYSFGLRGVRGADNTSLRIDDDNEPQPDAMLLLDPHLGGGTWMEGRHLRGSPELIVEVAASSARLDAGEKRELYRQIGIREYILWRVLDNRIDWWELVDGVYQPLPSDEAGVVRSRVFPGLWLDVPAMIQGRQDRVKTTLEAGLASPEHLSFASRLRGN
ncbi:Uma2 family endonuclease [Zavarzinella formosa]|uniref:Uma2 family endonuclease n=1 Tax=Zavarzinella formosa TaxID=360055 RepID=UPI00031A22E1|nr:Uma2 family endonuclease [Zavarzinella formosa]